MYFIKKTTIKLLINYIKFKKLHFKHSTNVRFNKNRTVDNFDFLNGKLR